LRRRVLIAVACLFAAAQAIRFERSNPQVTGEISAPTPVQRAFRQACYDCHSNDTAWPWSARVAPISWLVHYDVTEGRKRLNFSGWEAYASDPGTRIQKLKNLEKAMATDDMPPWYYRLLHPDSALSEAQRKVVIRWIAEQLADAQSSQ